MEARKKIELKFWENFPGGTLNRIGTAAESWWTRCQGVLSLLNSEIDAEKAPIELVNLLAWQRDIQRMEGEGDALYRKRVKYALANAKDAGSKKGFERIWQRLGLGTITQSERFDAENWDVIRLQVDETVFAEFYRLFDQMILQYGRTCRRYEFSSICSTPCGIRPGNYDCMIEHMKARAE